MHRIFLVPSLLLVQVCASCTGGSTTSSERICRAYADCQPASADEIAQCEASVEEALVDAPQRALQECLDCIETELCTDIEDGACEAACDDIFRDEPTDPPASAGTIRVTRDGTQLCPLDTWSGVFARNSGSTFDVDARCGDLSVEFQFPAMGVGGTETCNNLSVSGASDFLSCFDDSSSAFTGSATLSDVGGTLRLQGSCNCLNELDGSARVTLDVELR